MDSEKRIELIESYLSHNEESFFSEEWLVKNILLNEHCRKMYYIKKRNKKINDILDDSE